MAQNTIRTHCYMDMIPTFYIVLIGRISRYVTRGNDLKRFRVLHSQMLGMYL